jgi:hypothetical protein
LDPECTELLYPDTPRPQYSALNLADLSGVFVFIFLLIVFDVVVFLLELVISNKFTAKTQHLIEVEMEIVKLSLNVEEKFTIEQAREIKDKYFELIDLLAKHSELYL